MSRAEQSRAEQSRAEQYYRNKVAYLNILLAGLIVLRHSVNVDIYKLTPGVLYYIERFITEATDLVVPTFFALSGYLFYQNLKWKKLMDKYKSRFKSLILPYLIWGLIAFCFYVLISSIPVISEHMNQNDVSFSVENLCRGVFLHQYNGPLWFLQYLIGYVVITPVVFACLENSLEKKFPRIYGVCVVIIIVTISFFAKNELLRYLMPFLFGAYAGRYLKTLVKLSYKKTLRIMAMIILFISVLTGMFADFGRFYMVIRIIQVILIWITSDVLRTDQEPQEWMKISFVIYCSHTLILEPLEKLFFIAIGSNLLGAWLDFLLAPVITIAIISGLSCLCKRIPLLWKVLNGWR